MIFLCHLPFGPILPADSAGSAGAASSVDSHIRNLVRRWITLTQKFWPIMHIRQQHRLINSVESARLLKSDDPWFTGVKQSLVLTDDVTIETWSMPISRELLHADTWFNHNLRFVFTERNTVCPSDTINILNLTHGMPAVVRSTNSRISVSLYSP